MLLKLLCSENTWFLPTSSAAHSAEKWLCENARRYMYAPTINRVTYVNAVYFIFHVPQSLKRSEKTDAVRGAHRQGYMKCCEKMYFECRILSVSYGIVKGRVLDIKCKMENGKWNSKRKKDNFDFFYLVHHTKCKIRYIKYL